MRSGEKKEGSANGVWLEVLSKDTDTQREVWGAEQGPQSRD